MAPIQKPGRSKQDYTTPVEFLIAVMHRLHIDYFDADLASDDRNAIALPNFTLERSAFDAPTWKLGEGWNWLNPPFANIAPWVKRAYDEAHDHDARTAVLIPAGVGSNWWRDYVHGKALVLLLNGRLTFGGCPPNPRTGKVDAYPKDCALLLYSPLSILAQVAKHPTYAIWPWDPRT